MQLASLPPFFMDEHGYCYQATLDLAGDASLRPWWGRVDPQGYAIPGSEPEPPWQGQTVVCIASGPSLTSEDCQAARDTGWPAIVANSSFTIAPFAQIVIAVDHGWWQHHITRVEPPERRWTTSVPAAVELGVNLYATRGQYGNSGSCAIHMAIDLGAAQVVLLGYDCSLKHGTHWHGDHTRTMNPNAASVARWHQHFRNIAQYAQERGVNVVNCSRYTELECFPRAQLEDVLKTRSTKGANTVKYREHVNTAPRLEIVMTQPSDTLPKYFKDEAGYCYNATPALAKLPNLTPWDGSVDAQGFAVAEPEPEAKPVKSRPARTKSAPVDEPPAESTDEA